MIFRQLLRLAPGRGSRRHHPRRRRDHPSDHPHGVSWWKCRNQSLLMDAQMGFVCAGAVNPIAMRFLPCVEAATTGSGIAARLAASEDGANN